MTTLPIVRRAAQRMQTTLGDRTKRAVKLAVSSCLYTADRAVASLVPSHRRGRRSAGVVLMYHDVAPRHRQRFADQCDQLVQLANPTALVDIDVPGSPRDVAASWRAAVTFDDGFRSFSHVALPELERRGIPSAMFVTVEWARRRSPFAGDPLAIAEPDGSPIALTPDDLAQLPDSVEVGSHGCTHAPLPPLDDHDLKHELAGSRDELAAIMNRPVRFHAFPHGERNERVDLAAADAGYQRCYGIAPAEVRLDGSYVIGRVQVDPTDWPVEFRLKVLGAYRWVSWWMAAKGAVRSRVSIGASA